MYDGLVSAAEFMALPHLRREDEVQVRRVHVAVGHDRLPRQDGKGGRDARLAGSPFAADDHEFPGHPYRASAGFLGPLRVPGGGVPPLPLVSRTI